MAAGVFNASSPRILCVEGSRHRADALKQKRLTFVISVVGARQGYVPFYDKADAHTGNSVLRENTKHFTGTAPVMVPVRTLDQLIDDYEQLTGTRVRASLVKIDVQGFELEVLRGAARALTAAEVVLLETSVLPYNKGAPLIAEVMGVMHCLGFVALDMTETHYVGGTLLQLDFAFVRTTSPLVQRAYSAHKEWLKLGP